VNADVEISFWDGETFQFLSTLPVRNIKWAHLTDDGAKCFYATSPALNLIIDKILRLEGGPIYVWDTRGGKIDQTIAVRDGATERRVRGIAISPNEKFLAFVTQPPKGSEADRRLAVWEIDQRKPAYEIKPKYEIAPSPKINEYGVNFSPDGKYFSLDAGKTLQIYESATGDKRFELPDASTVSHWFDDNKTLLFEYSYKMEGYDVATGQMLYREKLIYEVYEYTENEMPVTDVLDETKIVAHPARKLFLTYSNQYVKVYDARTGAVLQTLVEPPMDYSKKKPRLSDKRLVSDAGWSDDGQTLYVINAERTAVTLWRLSED
jgi:WD40 repeat protein